MAETPDTDKLVKKDAEGPAPDRALEIKHLQSGDKIEAMQSGSSDLRTPVPARHLAFLETRGREFGYL